MNLTDDMQQSIKSIWDTQVHEGVSGRLYCTNYGLIKIASIIGVDYKAMGKQKKKNFRVDVISGYQMRFFQKKR